MCVRVVLVPFGASYRPDMKSEFKRAGWAVATYIPDVWLCESLCQDPAAAVVISGQWRQVRPLIAAVRAALPRSMVVVLLDDEGTKEIRIEAMNLGADACFPASCYMAELAAFVVAGVRRIGLDQESPTVTQETQTRHVWYLDEINRLWLGPKGEVLPLTTTELDFLRRLLSAPGWRLARTQFASTGHRAIAPEQLEVSRRTDVLISRLRTKAEGLGIKVPLLAVRQWGYMYLDEHELRRQTGLRQWIQISTRLSRCISSVSLMLPNIRVICAEG